MLPKFGSQALASGWILDNPLVPVSVGALFSFVIFCELCLQI